MGSTIFVFIGIFVLILVGGFLAFSVFDLILYCIEDNKWLWKKFWLSFAGLIFLVLGFFAFSDMIIYQNKVEEAKLEIYEEHLKEKTHYDFEIMLEDGSTEYLHNAICNFNDGITVFKLSDNSKIYFKDFKSIKEVPRN